MAAFSETTVDWDWNDWKKHIKQLVWCNPTLRKHRDFKLIRKYVGYVYELTYVIYTKNKSLMTFGHNPDANFSRWGDNPVYNPSNHSLTVTFLTLHTTALKGTSKSDTWGVTTIWCLIGEHANNYHKSALSYGYIGQVANNRGLRVYWAGRGVTVWNRVWLTTTVHIQQNPSSLSKWRQNEQL